MRIVFFGTPHFAEAVLKDLLEHAFNIVAVVTRPDQPQGRSLRLQPSVVKSYMIANRNEIPVYTPEKASSQEFINTLKNFSPDFFVVVGYGEILKQDLLDVPKKASINIHTSLLPAYRGAAPIQRAMMAGEKSIGITIMKMNAKMDAGAMLLQKSIIVQMNEVFSQVENKMIELAKEGIKQVLKNFEQYDENKIEQNLALVSPAPKILPEDCLIDPKEPAFNIQRKIMALSPKPGAFLNVKFQGETKRLKILDAETVQKRFTEKNFIIFDDGKIYLSLENDSLVIKQLQLEGKAAFSSSEFINGYKLHFPIKIEF